MSLCVRDSFYVGIHLCGISDRVHIKIGVGGLQLYAVAGLTLTIIKVTLSRKLLKGPMEGRGAFAVVESNIAHVSKYGLYALPYVFGLGSHPVRGVADVR